ncbi:DUF421 domain-containing protein [Rufibacter tibetensis]|uniref:Lipoprotein n=1 Tax=Rufibacter tibetensis TaxID=512763 RepID=A0A0P0CPP2_9BACT|nr:hypothetical protein [Rufibacter tibetensis]ALI98339.1 hypothetical protein DC20_04260 [Rufibacter tibetensis]
MKRLLPYLLMFLVVFSGCGEEKEEIPTPTPTPTPTPIPEKPKVADVETISAVVEANGSVTLTGKINKVNATDLDYGFMANLDSSFKEPPFKLIMKGKIPETGIYTMVIPNDDYRFLKNAKYYFSASVEVSKSKYQNYNIKSFVYPGKM